MLSLPITCTSVIGVFAPVFSRPVWQHVKVLLTGGDIEWVTQENTTEVVYRTEPHTSFWQRFTVGFLRLLPIEEQL